MSSMLKKPGAGNFKPKAPPRRRPVPQPVAQPTEETTQSSTAGPPSAAQESTPVASRDLGSAPVAADLEATNATKDRPSSRSRAPSRSSSRATRSSASRSPEATRRVPPSPKPAPAPKAVSAPIPSEDSATTNTPSATAPKSTTPRKGVSASPAKSTRATAVAKPKPVAETIAPEPPSVRAAESFPAPSAESVTPSVENGEGSSTVATKANAKPRKPAAKQNKKRKAAAAAGESEAETGTEVEGPPVKKKRAPRKKKATTNGAGVEDQPDGGEAAAPKRKSQRKRNPAIHNEGETEEENGTQQEEDDSEASDSDIEVVEMRKAKRRRRKRSVTPENAEEIEIDPEIVTLADLTKDLKSGKRWDKHELIKNAELERKREYQKRRLIRLGLLKEGEDLPKSDDSEAGTPAPESSVPAPEPTPQPAEEPEEPPILGGGPVMRIVNGQLVLDESSTQHDRHAEADRERGDLETKEEHEYSRRVTIRTNARRQAQTNFWPAEDTEKFYHGLRMFGTDFNMISKMFGGLRSRRQIKLKFNREERANPAGVNRCLIGEKDVAIDLTAVDGGDDLEETDAIEAELARQREEREAQERAEEEEIAAEARRKREELLGKRKGDRSHKDKHEIVVEEVIDEDAGGVVNGAPAVEEEANPAAKYGVGTDPDVIDETDLPPASAIRGRGSRGPARGRGGRRGGKAAHAFASGFGV